MDDASADRPAALPMMLKLGVPFGVAMGVFWSWQHGVVFGVVGGVVAGALFGVTLTLFARSKSVAEQTAIDLHEGETLVFSDLANHWQGRQAVGGRLHLTDQRLVFRPHAANLKPERFEVGIDEISSVTPKRSLGIIPNGVVVHLTDGSSAQFVVNKRRRWLEFLRGTTSG